MNGPARIALVLAFAGTAHADKRVNGFVAPGSGQIQGRVVDDQQRAIPGVQVHVLSSAGTEQTVFTDNDGVYRADTKPDETYSLVFVAGDGKVGGSVVTTEVVDDTEVVAMHDVIPPAVQPRPLRNPLVIPPYSEAAMDRNVWAISWLLLDVDASGVVKRIKVLDRAGYDLDPIAERSAFKLKFEPARDRAKHAVASLVLWSFEWPAYWWLHQQHPNEVSRIPSDAHRVPCRGTGPTHNVYRDCRTATVANAISQPWLDKPR